MKKWMTYLQERSPLSALSLLSTGMAIFPMALTGQWSLLMAVVITVGNLLLLVVMRMGDEIKDYQTDVEINPTRPLPRGLITVTEMTRTLYAFYGLLISLAIVLFLWRGLVGAMALLISLMFAYLMFKEFFIKKALDGSPLFYAFTHQLIVFPLYMWGGLTHDSSLLTSAPFLFWALSNMCASFTFEICRKLNPNAHVLAKTYAHHYGRPITATVASGFILLGGWALLQLELLWIASPLLLLLLIQLWLWVKRPQDFKKVEGLSVLFSLLSLLGPSLKILIGNGRP